MHIRTTRYNREKICKESCHLCHALCYVNCCILFVRDILCDWYEVYLTVIKAYSKTLSVVCSAAQQVTFKRGKPHQILQTLSVDVLEYKFVCVAIQSSLTMFLEYSEH